MQFYHLVKKLKYHRTYLAYAVAYGLTALVIPLGTSFLVNNLVLAKIWANTVSFLLIIGMILGFSQVFRHTMVILVEALQREIYVHELNRWRDLTTTRNSPYYFEIYTLMKTFSSAYVDIVDIILVTVFGLTVIVVFHPMFLILVLLFIVLAWYIRKNIIPAFKTSIHESNVKYAIYYDIAKGIAPSGARTFEYLEARDQHYAYIRRSSKWFSVLHVIMLMFVLAAGSWLITIDQLSVGQLVAAELIISGIMAALQKLPKTLESLYDFETSHYKIRYALKEHHAS